MVASSEFAELGPQGHPLPSEPDPAADASSTARPDATEFRAIYEAHFKLVWGSLRRLGVRSEDVMDLTQKVFITAYMRLDTFEGRSRLTTWLVAICQRLASDYRRSATFRREVVTEAAELEQHSPAAEDSSAAFAQRRRAVVAEAILNKLPEAQRTVFVLFELEELSGPEIADMLELSLGTVRSRLRLARESFAREVKRLGKMERSDEEGR
jgi:RNA polymerase sigma-70 factor (ECF subfamily)